MSKQNVAIAAPIQDWEKVLRGSIGPGDALALYELPETPHEAFAMGFNRAYFLCTSEQPVVPNRRKDELPDDPEGMNDMRASQADGAIRRYAEAEYRKGDGAEYAFGDLLCNLRHWSDRNGKEWQVELANAMENYFLETTGLTPASPADQEEGDDESTSSPAP